jgi:hypothetical protein
MFQMTREEFNFLKSQVVTLSWGGPRGALPYAPTEHRTNAEELSHR